MKLLRYLYDIYCFLYRYAAGLTFINADKMAVTGVSYGGYIAAMMLSDRHSDILACGVAVSPVVDWRYYGNLITEQVCTYHR